jgi:hypothetical protein
MIMSNDACFNLIIMCLKGLLLCVFFFRFILLCKLLSLSCLRQLNAAREF